MGIDPRRFIPRMNQDAGSTGFGGGFWGGVTELSVFLLDFRNGVE